LNKALTTIKAYKLVILILCFALTSVIIYWHPSSKAVEKKIPLSKALSNINGWAMTGNTPLDPTIVKALELDDYINQNYSNGSNTISLYIGYYLTTKKVGATHSPLVCFPGQGWAVSNTKDESLTIGAHHLQLASMIIDMGPRKELVLYWYQSFDKTSSGTFLQKIYALWAKFLNRGEENAFVRISISMDRQSIEKAFITGVEFINTFYPPFLKYVKAE
jgi:EpsI family protein